MAGAVRSKYLRLLSIYACLYAGLLIAVAFLNLYGVIILFPEPLMVIGWALLPLIYYAFVFRFAVSRVGYQVSYGIGVALVSVPMAVASVMTGGFESFNSIAIIILIFLAAMLGYGIPLLLVWVQVVGLAVMVAGGLADLGGVGIGFLMVGFYTMAAAVGWMTFHSYYTREDPEVERLRETLRNEELESEGVITAISDGVAIVDREGITIHANQRFLDMTALTRDELIGRHYSRVMSDKVRIVSASVDHPRIGPNVEKVLKTGEAVIIDNETIEYIDNRPPIDVSISIAPLKNDDGDVTAVMIIGHDISHIMELQRMKDSLIATASHELRTPITVIAGYADLLLGSSAGELNAKQRHYMERTKETTAHLTRMVNDMLDISQLESGQRKNNPESIDLPSFLKEIVADHLGQFAGRQVALKLGTRPGTLFADRSRLRQVIDGLLSNAYKFVPEGGVVTLAAKVKSDEAEISVLDNGPGIPEDSKEAIFEKFSKLDTTGSIPGTGLGLAIAKNIVENWNGHIAVENAPGGGARFYFTVPLAKATERPVKSKKKKEEQ